MRSFYFSSVPVAIKQQQKTEGDLIGCYWSTPRRIPLTNNIHPAPAPSQRDCTRTLSSLRTIVTRGEEETSQIHQTSAAWSSAAVRLHFYHVDSLWEIIKGKTFLPSYLLLCQRRSSNSVFLNTDYCINNSSLHTMYTLSLPFSFNHGRKHVPGFSASIRLLYFNNSC